MVDHVNAMPMPVDRTRKPAYAQWLWLGLAQLILGGVIAFNLYLEHGRAAAREQDRLATQARVITENTEHQLASANLALESVRGDLAHWIGSPGKQEGIRHLKALASAMQGIRTINVMDAKGRVIASNQPELLGRDLGYREYFQAVKQRPDADTLYVSPPFQTVLGAFAIVISRMIPGPRGEFAGILSVTLDPEYFRTLMMSVQYAPDMWVSVAHGDGLLFLMMPEHEGVQGMNIAQPGSFFTRHRNSGKEEEVLTGTVYATREMRMMALRTIRPSRLKMDKPLVVAASRDLDAIFQSWERGALTQAGLFGLVAIISSLGLYAYQRRQHEFDRKSAAAAVALRRSAERLQLATEASGIGVWDYDVVTAALVWDDSMHTLYGVDKSVGSGLFEMWSSCVFPEDMPAADAALKATLEQGAPYTPGFRIRRHSDGEVRYIQARARVYFDADGKPLRIVGTNEDITERELLKEKLEQQAQQDYLTGLSNRRHFMDQGQAELARAQRYGTPLSLLMLDIDRFKNINDTHGHKAGDIVLQRLSEIMRETLRSVDVIGRMGGEEFAILLPETDLKRATEVAERLRENVTHAQVALEATTPLQFTVSVGVSGMKGKDATLDILLNQADWALYEAKEGGRNKVCVA
jgi:diguanylate cyclase (GGDEF)-like protein/PAS domain S-box-containing protein